MKKKVLMIIPTLSGGGAERVVSNLTIQLKNEYDIDILLDDNKVEYPYCGNMIAMNEGICTSHGFLYKAWTYLRKLFLLRKMKKESAYDCYISHSKVSHILNLITGSNNCKIILTLHNKSNNYKRNKTGKIVDYFVKHYYKRADYMVAVSEGVRQEYLGLTGASPEKMVSIWNGSDIAQIHKKKSEELTEKQNNWFVSGKTLTTMGRLCEQKGQIHLIHAFSEVVKEMPDARLLILGAGMLEKKLKQRAEELGISKNVIFCGFQSNPFAILNKSDAFVFASLWEGFGYALEEAICCNLPCITTDFEYGAREIFHYKEKENAGTITETVYTDYGVLVPVCREEKEMLKDWCADGQISREEKIMADAIVTVLKNRDYRKRVIKNNQRRLDEFSLESMAKKWSEVIG